MNGIGYLSQPIHLMKGFISFFFIFVVTRLFSQNNYVVSEVFDENGISIQGINDIEEDEKGYLWIFGNNAVYRYDGFRLTPYYNIPDDSTSFPFRMVHNADLDERGVFWLSNGFDLNWSKNGLRSPKPPGAVFWGLNSEIICQGAFTFFSTNYGFAFYDSDHDTTKYLGEKSLQPDPDLFQQIESNGGFSTLAEIKDCGPNQILEKHFSLEKSTEVLIYSIGESAADFGTLEDEQGNIIWSANTSSSSHAGGSSKNRLYLVKITLEPGQYIVKFETDDSHDFSAWNAGKPDFSDLWGIRISSIKPSEQNSVDHLLNNPIETKGVLSQDGYTICSDNNGNIYYLSPGGINKFDPTGIFLGEFAFDFHTQFRDVKPNYYSARGMGYDMVAVKEDLLLISGPKGFARCNLKTGQINYFPIENYSALNETTIYTLFKDNRENYLIGTSNGIFRLRPATMNVSPVLPESKILQTSIRGFYQDRNGNYFVYNNKNLYKISPSRFNEYKLPLLYAYVSGEDAFYVDRNKNYWFADTASHLAIYDNTASPLIAFDLFSYLNNQKLSPNTADPKPIISIHEADDSLILVNFQNHYLISVNPMSRELLFAFDFREHEIAGMYTDQNNQTFVFTHSAIFKLKNASELLPYAAMPNADINDSDIYFDLEQIRFLHEDELTGKIYFELFDALFIFDKNAKTVSRRKLNLVDSREMSYNVGDSFLSQDKLYFATQAELITVDLQTDSIEYFIHCEPVIWFGYKPTLLVSDGKGNLYLSTSENGLLIFSTEAKTFSRLSRKDGLIDNKILNLNMDEYGKLWITTPAGISRYDCITNSFQNFSESYLPGRKPTDYNLYFNRQTPREIVYYTGDGLVKIDPGVINPVKPQVDVFDIRINNKEIQAGSELSLNYWQNSLSFEFIVLDLTSPKMNTYAYQLKGYDRTWVTGDHSIRKGKYMNLPPGNYELWVKGANSSGVWSDEIKVLRFEILSPWWETTWFRISLVCLLLLIALILFKWRTRQLRKRQKELEEKIDVATHEIRLQKDEIEVQHREIKDSIQYAKRIQEAILPPAHLVRSWLRDSFIIYKPKDIVAGDFYWLDSIRSASGDEIILFSVGDCTGHGVPGAMVSVVCHNALNRSVREFALTQPAQILDKTRELVIEAFASEHSAVKDGMDAALVALHIHPDDTYTVEYAGANNSIYFIKDGNFCEIKPDKQPIGQFTKSTPFTNHIIDLKKGDTIYLFSDGFADQFGGPKGKKFKYEAFREMISKFSSLSMNDQRLSIEKTYESWRGDFEQLDDICVIGVRL